jgi:hypothetical protein
MTDITEHPTREGKLYCRVVLDAWSRRAVGWSLDRRPTAAMVNSALGMAVEGRRPRAGTLIHSDHGSQFTSWTFSQRLRAADLAHSLGSVGDAFDNAVVESFWAHMQTELLNTRKWRPAPNLSTEILDWIEVFYNRTRRHTSLRAAGPIAYEKLHADNTSAARLPQDGSDIRGTDQLDQLPGPHHGELPVLVATMTPKQFLVIPSAYIVVAIKDTRRRGASSGAGWDPVRTRTCQWLLGTRSACGRSGFTWNQPSRQLQLWTSSRRTTRLKTSQNCSEVTGSGKRRRW